MGTDNYRYNQGSFDEMLTGLKSKKAELDELAEQIRGIVQKNLLENGITGTTADSLLKTFDTEVIQKMTEFADSADINIQQNEKFKELADETSSQNNRTASMV